MGGQERGLDDQEGFVVLMGRRWAPVEGPCDHGAVVDHSELVKPTAENPYADWDLRDWGRARANPRAIGSGFLPVSVGLMVPALRAGDGFGLGFWGMELISQPDPCAGAGS
jgi:hypothetical protein